MTVRMLKFLLYVCIWVTAVAGLFGLVAVSQGIAGAETATTTVALRIDPANATSVKDLSGTSVGTLLLDRGTLNVHADGPLYAFFQGADIFITFGLWIGLFVLTLKLVDQIGAGRPFNDLAIRRFRLVGWMLISLNVWYWLRQIALPPLLLSSINPVAGEYRLLPMISEGVSGLRNARVDGNFGFGLLAAGAIALLLSEAFRLGATLREDTESIL